MIWFVLLTLLLLTAMFFALIARSFRHLNHHQLEELAQQRDRLESYQKHLPDHDLMQMTAGILAVLLEATLTVLVVILLIHALGPGPIVTAQALVLSVFLVGVLCEGLTEFIARFNAEPIVLAVSPLMAVISIPFRPVLRLDRWLEGLLRHSDGETEDETPTQELTDEILSAVTEGEQSGALDDKAGEMIEGVISLRQVDVTEVMTPRTRIVAVRADQPLEAAVQLALSRGHSRLPVFENNLDNVVGVVLLKDLVGQLNKPEAPDLRQLMRQAYFVPETKTIAELLRELQKAKIQTAIVLDEYGGTAGLVTIEDILEEIVGEIVDEHDRHEAPPIKRIDHDTVEAGPRCNVDELNDALGLELPEDPEYDTVSGFVLHVLERIPRTGEKFETHGALFEVLQADARSVGRIRITRLPEQD